MALIDSRGRVWGRFNLIDLVAGVVLVALVPVVYGAFLLFRQPEPTIKSVSPAKLPAKVTRVRVHGEKLRPFLRVFFNEHQGTTFALIDEQTAEVEVPALPPGTYDLILFDVAREISRLPQAVTVDAPPVVDAEARVLIWGTFLGLQSTAAAEVKPGLELSVAGGGRATVVERDAPIADARVVDFGEPVETPLSGGVRVAALLRATCHIVTSSNRCQLGGGELLPRTSLVLTGSGDTAMRFDVGRVSADGPTQLVQLRATFAVPPEGIGAVRAGDRAAADSFLSDRVPTIMSIGSSRRVGATVAPPATRPGAVNDIQFGLPESMLLVDAVVRVRADVTSNGFAHRGQPLRVGQAYVFETGRYVLRGWIRAVDAVEDNNGDR